MSKNILIFADGTGQAGGIRPDQNLSNVYKLYRATRVGVDSTIDPIEQTAFYDPGLGTQSDASGLSIGLFDKVRQMLGNVTGSGISENIIDCYEAILKAYEPGDRIFLFGFSRGAYTARSLAGVINLCGIPTHDADGGQLPQGKRLRILATEAVKKVYEHGAGKDRGEYESEREELGRRFRIAYGSEDPTAAAGESERGNVAPEFIGVFDTVAALGSQGWRTVLFVVLFTVAILTLSFGVAFLFERLFGTGFPYVLAGALLIFIGTVSASLFRARFKRFKAHKSGEKSRFHFANWRMKNYDRFLDPRTGYARQALAIDETRVDFIQVGWGHSEHVKAHSSDPITWLKQVWFAGNHSDIGGSYPESESRLSDIALNWMIEEATSIPFPIKLDKSKLNVFPNARGIQHCEVNSLKESLGFASKWLGWKAAPRTINPTAMLHPSVLDRFDADQVQHCTSREKYRPNALRLHEQVKKYYVEEDHSC